MNIPQEINLILDQGLAYLYSHPTVGLIVFANAKLRPCKSAPPRKFWIDKYADHSDDYTIWAEKYGKTVNLIRGEQLSNHL